VDALGGPLTLLAIPIVLAMLASLLSTAVTVVKGDRISFKRSYQASTGVFALMSFLSASAVVQVSRGQTLGSPIFIYCAMPIIAILLYWFCIETESGERLTLKEAALVFAFQAAATAFIVGCAVLASHIAG
jgi:hypothetical protein